MPAKPLERQHGACRHLGEQTGLRDCPTCGGNVRIKLFACAHPDHDETTLAECAHCNDFEAVVGIGVVGSG